MTPTAAPQSIESLIEGVTALERKFRSKAHGGSVTQRLYTCPNGLSLGARRGGALHQADEKTWEVFTMADGIVYGAHVGWVTDAQLAVAVERLAAWS